MLYFHTTLVFMMSLRKFRILALFVTVAVIGGSFASCKTSHELCPAYTKAVPQSADQNI